MYSDQLIHLKLFKLAYSECVREANLLCMHIPSIYVTRGLVGP